MTLRRCVALALRAPFAHKVRATLALAGVSVGVAAVVIASALGTGAAEAVQVRIQGMGANLLVVRPVQVKKLVARGAVKGLVTTLRLEDAAAVGALDIVADAAPGVEAMARVKGGGAATKTMIVGTTSAFQAVRRFRVRSGRFLTDGDNRASARVAVLGARVADALFPDDDPLGRQVRIRDVPFDVIGVLAEKGVQADGDEDNQVVVPIQAALRRVFNVTSLSTIFVSVRDDRAMAEAEDEIGAVLRDDHRRGRTRRPDDFEIQNAERMFALQQQTAESLRLLTGGLAGLTMLVGGTGVLALMMMSVRERTPEIGLRMAVGARPRDVLVQFLLEAVVITLAGWAVGLVVGALGAAAVAFATTWAVGVPVSALMASCAMTLSIGFGFGAFPAYKASRVPPIDALLAAQ